MKALQVVSLGEQPLLKVVETPVPEPTETQAVIKVSALALSHADLLRTRGLFQQKAPLPFVLGGQASGEVISAGSLSRFKPGDSVIAIPGIGCFAEYVAVEDNHLIPMPSSLGWVDAAAGSGNHLTAHFALTRRGRLTRQDSVMVLGAGGGVGLACVQIAREYGTAAVIAVARSEEQRRVARDAGADVAISPGDLADPAWRGAVDLIADPVGGDLGAQALTTLRDFGRYVCIGFASGKIPAPPLNRALFRNLEFIGAGWGSYFEQDPAGASEQWRELTRCFMRGSLRPVIRDVFHPMEYESAMRSLEARSAVGTVVIDFTRWYSEVSDDERSHRISSNDAAVSTRKANQ